MFFVISLLNIFCTKIKIKNTSEGYVFYVNGTSDKIHMKPLTISFLNEKNELKNTKESLKTRKDKQSALTFFEFDDTF
ncbi:hypothetical protein AAJ76_3000166168 [Vairimorpha ceranae]|uniref:Uncharacterized protein n=1 Tax=Vairimorpha ceranae TaxID=40302 RepID=A0A0F9ZGU9_9MICR|nr:hypothetical protein AAJ76_3000166168 [Vairimorpha ceranae]KAF5140236.1 hypothetical protein G9O61_00g016230 [Vairimorpha ceranae]KKO76484.1 hypothetical protein AAJ76_3000166168 [Vairimorpha ceranae]